MTTLEDAARERDQLPEALPLALRLADEQERALLAVANGEMKIGKLPLEPYVRGYTELRRLQAELEALRGRTRVTDEMVDVALIHWFNEFYIEQNHGIQYRMRMALVQALKRATPPAQEDGNATI